MRITEEIIKKHESQLTEAEKNGDKLALDKLLCNDFNGINIFGYPIDKDGFISHACNPDIEIAELNVLESSVKIVGSVGIVIGKASFSSTYKGNPVNGTTRFLDVWELRLGECILVSSTVSIDGESRK
mgnify:CR=1 FL=1